MLAPYAATGHAAAPPSPAIRHEYGARDGEFSDTADRVRTCLYQHSNRSLFARRNSAGKKIREARDWGRVFGDIRRFRAAETARSRVSGGKAAESQRLFRRRQESGVAQDCVVELAGLEIANK
jgi:hypothetical protein